MLARSDQPSPPPEFEPLSTSAAVAPTVWTTDLDLEAPPPGGFKIEVIGEWRHWCCK